jgi:MFS family permease
LTLCRCKSKAIEHHNIRILYLDVGLYGVTNGIASTFMAVFALRMGASDQQIGLLAALPAFVYIFWFIPAGRLVESSKSIKATGLVGVFFARLQFVLIALLPFLPAGYRVPALLACIMLAGIPLCVANVAFTNVIADVVPPADRPRVVSRRSILQAVTTAAASAAGGKLLGIVPLPVNYQVLFLIAFGFSMLSLFALSRITVADCAPSGVFSLQPGIFARQIRDMVATAWATPAFLRFTVAAFVMHASLQYAWPLFSLWWVNGLKAWEGLIGLIATANMLASIASNVVWARVAERRGNRFCLMAGFGGIVFIPVINALLPRAEYLLLTETLAGLIVPALTLGVFNTLLEVSPVARRPIYIAVYSAAVNIPICLGPIIATTLVVPLVGVQLGLALATPLRLAAWITMFVLLRRIAAASPDSASALAPRSPSC